MKQALATGSFTVSQRDVFNMPVGRRIESKGDAKINLIALDDLKSRATV